jgi:hypothetical protein
MDLAGYEKFSLGKLSDYELPQEALKKSLESIKNLPQVKMQKTGKW